MGTTAMSAMPFQVVAPSTPDLAQVRAPCAEVPSVIFLHRVRRWLEDDPDLWAEARGRIVRHLSWLAATLLAVSSLAALSDGYPRTSAISALLVLMMAGNAWALQRRREPVVPFWVPACALVVGNCCVVLLRGMPGLYGACLVLFVVCFSLPPRRARVLAVLMLVCVTTCCAFALGWSLALRFGLTLSLLFGMINAVLMCIGELQQALITQASTDPLTGALNRRQLDHHLDRLAATDAAQAASRDALLAIDIDHFKTINDRHGHQAGDEVLRRLVATVHKRKRRGDQLFRVGGEEFLLLLPGVSHGDARRIADELRQLLAETDLLPGTPVTVSIGVSLLTDHADAGAWMRSADQALYEAKRSGRNRVVMATQVWA